MMGPESDPPYWCRSRGGLGTAERAKKLRASNTSLLPDLVETDTTPAPRPNSAENVPVSTLNSRTDSTDGVTMTVLNVYSLLSMPSMSQALALAWEPSALKLLAPRGLKVDAPER